MHEEEECDSDEDFVVYFLKPVHEYNIADKIKQSNKELFENKDTNHKPKSARTGRKVTFALDLVEYFEPETWNESTILEPSGNETIKEEQGNCADVDISKTGELDGLVTAFTRLNINEKVEQEELNEENVLELSTVLPNKMSNHAPTPTNEPEYENKDELMPENTEYKNEERHDIDEEICEEILLTDSDIESTSRDGNFATQKRRMFKQDTFDFDTQETDNDTKFLAYDSEETYSHETGEEEDDDDDKLSIIVASYLPDNFETSTKGNADSKKRTLTQRLPMKPRTTINKRCQLRGGANSANSSSVSTTRGTALETFDLKFNYKTCCESRYAIQGKLPRYTGYLSEYGLSREQLVRREEFLHKKQQFLLEQTLKTNEQEMRKMEDNERAFTTWLRNKMRFPINKNSNMFDVQQRFRASNSVNKTTTSKNRNRGNPN